MAEVRVNISGTSPVKSAGAKKKTVKFVASSKKFKVTGKPPSALGVSMVTDGVSPQLGDGGAFEIINSEEIVIPTSDWPQPRASFPSSKTKGADLGVNTSGSANGASTDPSDVEDKHGIKTNSLADLSSCNEFSVRIRRASQPSRTKLSPAALKARCVRRRLNRLSGGDLFHLYTRRFMNTFLRRQPPRQHGNILNMKPDTQAGETSDACTGVSPGVLGTTMVKNSGTTSQGEMEQSLGIPEESCAVTSKEVPAVFTEVDDEIQFRCDRTELPQDLVELDNC